MKIEVLQCDECGVITDDLQDKDWVRFSETIARIVQISLLKIL